jgi:predicted RNA-binding Zn-ribbon protein involved in translation (DUF1610 family)
LSHSAVDEVRQNDKQWDFYRIRSFLIPNCGKELIWQNYNRCE